MSELSPKDRKILKAALDSGHAFEKFFNSENEEIFRISLESCTAGESFLIQKLAELASKVSLSLGPKHLMALLVPLERLSGRSARDEEFLFSEKDGFRTATPSRESVPAGRRIVICENIRSAFNVGSIYRTIETFGGTEVWLSGYSPDPQKTAMGADALVSTRRFERTSDAIREAGILGFKIVALENAPGAVPLESFQWPADAVLIVGNERFGLDSQTLSACDHVVRISTTGQKNSLNVGIAFGIAAASWSLTNQASQTPAARTHSLTPIGYLRGGYQNSQVAPRQPAYLADETSSATIELEARFEGRPSNFDQALRDLAGFERAWVIFGFDQSEGWKPQVRPPRGAGEMRGLFATRSPHRPNRLGLSCVRIRSVQSREVQIFEHDLLEGTPIYDIKPYVPEADAFPNSKSGWLDEISVSAYRLEETGEFQKQLAWLEKNGERRLRSFVNEQLQFQPFDQSRKRTVLSVASESPHSIAFRTWRIEFRELPGQALLLIGIKSGYTDQEMRETSDLYEDKKQHGEFREAFYENH